MKDRRKRAAAKAEERDDVLSQHVIPNIPPGQELLFDRDDLIVRIARRMMGLEVAPPPGVTHREVAAILKLRCEQLGKPEMFQLFVDLADIALNFTVESLRGSLGETLQ